MSRSITQMLFARPRRQPLSREERVARIAMMMDTVELAEKFYAEHAKSEDDE